MLNLGFTTETEIHIDGSLFANLSTSVIEECPLLFEVVEHLFLILSGGKVQTGGRVNSASHGSCNIMQFEQSKDYE